MPHDNHEDYDEIARLIIEDALRRAFPSAFPTPARPFSDEAWEEFQDDLKQYRRQNDGA